MEAAQALAAGVPCGLAGRGSLPQGARWLWWEQIVFTPSPHAQPTLASYSQGSPTPGLCTVCTLAAPTAEWPPSAENSSSGGCPGPRRPFLGPLSPVPAAGLKTVRGVGWGSWLFTGREEGEKDPPRCPCAPWPTGSSQRPCLPPGQVDQLASDAGREEQGAAAPLSRRVIPP